MPEARKIVEDFDQVEMAPQEGVLVYLERPNEDIQVDLNKEPLIKSEHEDDDRLTARYAGQTTVGLEATIDSVNESDDVREDYQIPDLRLSASQQRLEQITLLLLKKQGIRFNQIVEELGFYEKNAKDSLIALNRIGLIDYIKQAGKSGWSMFEADLNLIVPKVEEKYIQPFVTARVLRELAKVDDSLRLRELLKIKSEFKGTEPAAIGQAVFSGFKPLPRFPMAIKMSKDHQSKPVDFNIFLRDVAPADRARFHGKFNKTVFAVQDPRFKALLAVGVAGEFNQTDEQYYTTVDNIVNKGVTEETSLSTTEISEVLEELVAHDYLAKDGSKHKITKNGIEAAKAYKDAAKIKSLEKENWEK